MPGTGGYYGYVCECMYIYEICVGNRTALLLLVGVSGCRGSGLHEDGGKEGVAGGAVGFRVEVGGVIVCVALAENYGLIHDALANEVMFGMDVSGLCGGVECYSN